MDLKKYEYWFIVGSQNLYGDETLKQVAEHARIMTDEFNKDSLLPDTVVLKPTAITPQAIRILFEEANASNNCLSILYANIGNANMG
jgi:L-arabinose isomerase